MRIKLQLSRNIKGGSAWILVLFLIAISSTINAQIDSLSQQLKETNVDTNRVNLLTEIGQEYLSSDPLTARNFFIEGFELSKQLNFEFGMVNLSKLIGTSYYYQGKIDNTAYYWRMSLNLVPSGEPQLLANSYNNLAIILLRQGEIDSSLLYNSKSLMIRVGMNDSI